jgi:hypothetical protein
MDTIFAITGYPTSQDYELLAFLMQRQSLLCIVDYHAGDTSCRDVGKTLWSPDGATGVWQLSARGIGYIYAFSRQQFIAECAKAHVEFLIPKL